MRTKRYVAIRKALDDGHEFIDMSTASGLMDVTQQIVKNTAVKIPHWDAANPVQRIVNATITAS